MVPLRPYLARAVTCGWLLAAIAPSSGADTEALLGAWLNAQTNLQSWSADFTQTRRIKTLAQPLVARGKVWFRAPNLFHWELGQPAQTIAVREPAQLVILYPRLHRAERVALTGEAAGPWRDALALFEAGFPRSRVDLDARFHIRTALIQGEACEVTLEPKAAGARRLMPEFKLTFEAREFSLRATELKFADGSTLRNDFTNVMMNPVLDPALFTPAIPADFTVIEPGRGGAR